MHLHYHSGCHLSTEQSCNVCVCAMCFSLYAQIAVIASRSTEHAKDFAQKHGIPEAHSSYEELANDPQIGKFIIICLLIQRQYCV